MPTTHKMTGSTPETVQSDREESVHCQYIRSRHTLKRNTPHDETTTNTVPEGNTTHHQWATSKYTECQMGLE